MMRAMDRGTAPPAAETSCRLKLGGAELAWWRMPAAPAARGCVVLLHGLASNATRWSEFVEHGSLAGAWALLRVDLRGHGASQPAGRATLEVWCDDLAAILDAEGAARAVFVGHSLGAQVALHMVQQHPRRVQALVLVEPVFCEALTPRWARIARLGPLLDLVARVVRRLNATGLRRRQVIPDDLRALDAMARQALLDPSSEAAFIRRYSSTRHDLKQFRTAQYLQDLVEMFRPTPPLEAVAVPVLTLLSAGATFADAAPMRAALARLPYGEVRPVECHHWPLTEKPAEVRQAIEAWIARRAGDPG
jgi:pimeloyl-ACP methyl ester carboxylesterase